MPIGNRCCGAAALLWLTALAACEPPLREDAAGRERGSASGAEAPRDYVAEPLVDASERTAGPARIVSAAPSATELCAALGLSDRLVGRTQFCAYPPAVRQVPIIGAYTDANLEAIVAAHPDCVLVTTSSPRLKEQFSALDLPLVELPDSSFEDLFVAAHLLGERTGRPRTAARLVQNLERDLDSLRQPPRNERVLIVTGPLSVPPSDPFVAGPGSFLDHLVALAGFQNAVAGLVHRPWGQISLETVIQVDPEVLLEAREDAWVYPPDAIFRSWGDLDMLQAVRNRRIRSVPIWVLNPGPRVNLALHAIVEALR